MREREKKRESDPDKQLELDIVADRGENKRRDGEKTHDNPRQQNKK